MKDIKLKYYLRGLGIGVLVTALILGISGSGEETMTDAQVRERAMELGMVDADSLVLSELRESEQQLPEESIPEEPEVVPEENESIPEESETMPESTAEPDVMESEVAETQESVTEEAPQETQTVTVEIRSGASSYTVSKDMEAAGLINDAGKFDSFLCDNGYSRSIRVGTYEITVGSTEEEIAKIITGKR